jgi:integrase
MRTTGHIRQRSKGSYELRYSLGTNSATGKRRMATATIRGTRKDAERELRRLLRTLDTGEHVDPTRMTVGMWLETWLDTVGTEISPKSHERYTEIVQNHLIPAFGALPISKLTKTHIRTSYALWAKGGRLDGKPGGLSPLTRRYFHRLIRMALTRAVEDDIIARNPTDIYRKRLPKIEKKQITTLSAAQSVELLGALAGSGLFGIVLLALATGMRRGEILALRWKNVHLERHKLSVVESLEQTKSGLRFKSTKTNKERAIALPSFAVEKLRDLKRQQAAQLLALGVSQTADTLVCSNSEGQPRKPRSVTHAFAREVARLPGIPRIRFHDLRHTHATQLLVAGVHPKIVQERLGHSTISITLDIYSHVVETIQEGAALRLDEEIGSAISELK